MKKARLNLKTPRILAIVNLVLVFIIVYFAFHASKPMDIVLYVDSKCEFCEQTIAEINFREYKSHLDLNIKSLEGNSLNKRSFNLNADICEINEDQRGVPMLYAKGKCFKGKLEILQELERLSIQN